MLEKQNKDKQIKLES